MLMKLQFDFSIFEVEKFPIENDSLLEEEE
jgi:hypothetical protein